MVLCFLHKVEGVSLAVGLQLRAGRLGEVPRNPASGEGPLASRSEEPGEPGRSLAEAAQQNPAAGAVPGLMLRPEAEPGLGGKRLFL